ncbi:MAG TPA: hypothetical protein VNY05_38110 [Candidatus Acidoferrales bacterium]|jgi:hypothetical protein|nr:hypothetical protein [Candidatus Acidoferrales bacterium]
MGWPAAGVTAWFLRDQDHGLECGELLLILMLAAFLLLCPRGLKTRLRVFGSVVLRPFQRRKPMALMLVCLAPLVLRVALLPAAPPPIPWIADEFSHLLLADTLAAGRVANPPHPMAAHFETLYVLQQPVYASIYPPGHGFAMAMAQGAGLDPWFGVLAETGIMLLAIAWMLRAWFPSRWVLLGLLIAMVRLGVWMNSYWGGSLAAAGGALVVGSLTRLTHRVRARDGLVLGLGLTILVNTRPYEAVLLGLVAMVALAVIGFHSSRVAWRDRWRRLLAPIGCSLALGAALTSFYNWRVTGRPLMFPYMVSQQQYGVPQMLAFQAHVPPPVSKPYRDVMDNYWWQRAEHNKSRQFRTFWEFNYNKLASFWHFYLHPLCSIPLIALPCVLRSRNTRFLLCAGLFVTLGTALYPFYFPQYSAPVAGILVILSVQGWRYLAAWTRRFRGGGLLIPSAVVAVAGIGGFLVVLALTLHSSDLGRRSLTVPSEAVMRKQIEGRFAASGGRHLVVVRYGPNHILHFPVIYNRARIDESPVVWARELGPQRDEELLRYYANRTAWLFEPDKTPPEIEPYPRASGSIAYQRTTQSTEY